MAGNPRRGDKRTWQVSNPSCCAFNQQRGNQQRGGLNAGSGRPQQAGWRGGQRPTPPYPIMNAPRQPEGPILRFYEQWQTWPELTVRITQLPPTITTWDLYKRFNGVGTIVFIELHENSRGLRQDSARIRFSPPPNTAFWSNNPITIRIDNPEMSEHIIRAFPESTKRTFEIQSPIQKNTFYPETITLFPQQLSFGIMFSETVMMKKRTEVERLRNEMKLKIDILRKRIVAEFDVDYEGEIASTPGLKWIKHMFQVPFGQLKVMHRVKVDNERWALLLTLDSPPQFYLKDSNIERTHIRQALIWSEFDSWFRVTDVVADSASIKTAVISLNKLNRMIDIGRWTTYLFEFESSSTHLKDFQLVTSALQDYNIDIIDLEAFSTIPNEPAKVWDMIEAPKVDEATNELHCLMEDSDRSTILPFDVRYQLEVCISRNILEAHNITPEFIKELATLADTNTERAISILEYISEQEKRIYDIMSIFKDPDALAHSPKSKIPTYCAYARKATVTPTTIYFSSPTVETSNRVIRKYSAYGDRFLRVQFTDELFEGRINSCADKVRNDQVFTRVYRTLKNGIRIGDRHFEFLAFGNSQFRENGAYFFCPTNDLSCAQIRKWMGRFNHINVVAKYAARLGLCFSTTRAIRNSGMKIKEIHDVERNGYNFTDGVGKISPFLMKMIATELHLPYEPSVVQFRMGGCKGILAVSPDAKSQEVHIRKSQTKFTAEYMGLEIIRTSSLSVATLNRQTITILSSLGVEDDVFNRLLDDQLSNYVEAMEDPEKAVLLLDRYMDDNHMTLNIANMVLDGFMRSKEPFVQSLLHLWRSWSIKLLKEKAKIIVEKGAFVLGCTDETGTLRGHSNMIRRGRDKITPEDIEKLPQIFLQRTDRSDRRNHIVVEGLCLVGRNPSLHPGDIRVVQAINVPALHHLHDVVVFSQLGDRDVPSMCSGGDLDGDDFFVIWDSELIPREWNAEPMDYTPPAPVRLERPVEINDVMSFFVKYMKNDSLPTIAHAHLALSDQLDLSVRDPKCLELAALHSKAVDFVKSGIPADMPKHLRPRRWPHFMEKKHKPKEQIYFSTNILGQLYDKVERVEFTPHYEAPFDKRILRAYEIDRAILKATRQIKSQYDTAMRRIMAQHEINSEFEVWTAFVLSKPRVGSDYKVQEEMGVISSALKDRFKEICTEAAGGKDFKILGPFVAAMYRVTWEEMSIALHECRTMKTIGGRDVPRRKMEPKSMPLMSFPWLFQTVLGRIAKGSGASDLEDLALPFVNRSDPHVKKPRFVVSDEFDPDDYIETADGITHRGQLLDLFRPDDIDSDGDEIIRPYYETDVGTSNFKDMLQLQDGLNETAILNLDKKVDTENEHSTTTSLGGPPEIDILKPNVNNSHTADSNLIDTSEPRLISDREVSVGQSFADISELEVGTTPSCHGDLVGLVLADDVLAEKHPLQITPQGVSSQDAITSLIPALNVDISRSQSTEGPPTPIDILANFLDAESDQANLFDVSGTPQNSRRSSHCEDLAGLHIDEDQTVVREDILVLDKEPMGLLAQLLASTPPPVIEDPELQKGPLELITKNDALGAEKAFLDEISSATIQGNGGESDLDDRSDCGEEIVLDIEDSALEKLQKLYLSRD